MAVKHKYHMELKPEDLKPEDLKELRHLRTVLELERGRFKRWIDIEAPITDDIINAMCWVIERLLSEEVEKGRVRPNVWEPHVHLFNSDNRVVLALRMISNQSVDTSLLFEYDNW